MIRDVVREASASAKSQPVASLLTMFLVAGMVVAVMLTTGRTVGAEQQVLSSIDSVGTRSLVVWADEDSGVTAAAVRRISSIEGIEWAGGFSRAIDAHNAAFDGGTPVPVRYVSSAQLDRLGVSDSSPVPEDGVWVSPMAAEQLGLHSGSGGITLESGQSFAVLGLVDVPEYLEDLEPLILAPRSADDNYALSVVIVLAERPELVLPMSKAVFSLLGTDDPSKVTVETSQALAQLRGVVQGQLGSFSRGLVLALLSVTALLIAILLYGLVAMRRKDFGRRRALGATRGLIVGLLLTQTLLLTLLAVGVGMIVSTAVLIIGGDPFPGMRFVLSLSIVVLGTSLIGASVPAIIASRREPIRELRVP